ncbi:hypothetical protein M3926_001920 [Vibrio metschnikovii]|nr:hypothetical protein [Vibrio metschnikovii]
MIVFKLKVDQFSVIVEIQQDFKAITSDIFDLCQTLAIRLPRQLLFIAVNQHKRRIRDRFIIIMILVGLKDTATKRGPMPKLQRQIEQVALLPKAKQKFVSEMLETVIQQAAH